MENRNLNYPLRSKGLLAPEPKNGVVSREPLPLLSTEALATITDTSKSTWEKMRMRGEGPPYIKVRNLVWYRWADVEAWLAAHEVSNQGGV
ncbi:helix-turn-helix transcriptional regulator [Nioella aestuarii]|uniref:helix-turn-helix transcriptional regulator n=1 Tax=Nioella aestuarii TaxID=1662864 RepID=UPI003D7F6C63